MRERIIDKKIEQSSVTTKARLNYEKYSDKLLNYVDYFQKNVFAKEIDPNKANESAKIFFDQMMKGLTPEKIESNKLVLGGILFTAMINSNNDECKDAMGWGMEELINKILPKSIDGMGKYINKYLIDDPRLLEVVNEYKSKHLKGELSKKDYEEFYGKLKELSVLVGKEDQIEMIEAMLINKMEKMSDGTKETIKKEEIKKTMTEIDLGKVKDPTLKNKLAEIIEAMKADEEYMTIKGRKGEGSTKEALHAFDNELMKLYRTLKLSDGDKEILSSFTKKIETKIRAAEAAVMGEGELSSYFRAFHIVYDSYKNVEKKISLVETTDNSVLCKGMERCWIAKARLELLLDQIESGGEMLEAEDMELVKSIIGQEIENIDGLYEKLEGNYYTNQKREYDSRPEDDRLDLETDTRVVPYTKTPPPIDIRFKMFMDGSLVPEKRGDDEKAFMDWFERNINDDIKAKYVDSKGNLLSRYPEEYVNQLRRQFRYSTAVEGKKFSENSKRYFSQFRAFLTNLSEEVSYTQGTLLAPIKEWFAWHKPPREIGLLCPSFYGDQLSDERWMITLLAVNDTNNAVAALNSYGNMGDNVKILENTGASFYTRDLVNFNEVIAGYKEFSEELWAHYFQRSDREPSIAYNSKGEQPFLTMFTVQGQKDFNFKDRGTMKREAKARIMKAIEDNVERNADGTLRYDHLKGLLKNEDTRMFLDLAFILAWDQLYISHTFSTATPEIIPVFDKMGNAVIDPATGEQEIMQIGAGAMKKMCDYGISQHRNFWREWKKFRMWRYLIDDPESMKGMSAKNRDIEEGPDGKKYYMQVKGDQEKYMGALGSWVVHLSTSGNLAQRVKYVEIIRELANFGSPLIPDRLGHSVWEFWLVGDQSSKDPEEWKNISYAQAVNDRIKKMKAPIELKEIFDISEIPEKAVIVEEYKDPSDKFSYIKYKYDGGEYMRYVNNKKEKSEVKYYVLNGMDTNIYKRYTTAECMYAARLLNILLGKGGYSAQSLHDALHDLRTITLPGGFQPFIKINEDPKLLAAIILQIKGVENFSVPFVAGYLNGSEGYTKSIRAMINDEFNDLIGLEDNDPTRLRVIEEIVELLGGGRENEVKNKFWKGNKEFYAQLVENELRYYRNKRKGLPQKTYSMFEAFDYLN